ncbi:metallophosphoesterase [Mucilaginibacter sp.]|uniref:metallophosphoesterase n=1 Tax=Mucilaginibacter sp. TaxID=1882438 RepID=UPI0025F93E4C|nr:metallophosphoesterase [Mucilaginibacter sp.]
MRLQYVSDLHLEFPENKVFIKNNPIEPKGDILVLAGDVLPFILIDKHKDFFNYVSDNFEQVYWVPGNHEYYHFDAAKKSGAFCENIRSNVSLLNNQTIVLDSVHLIFSTLWSRISPDNWWHIEKNMNDFRIIKYDGYRFSFDHYNQLHAQGLAFVENALDTAGESLKKVVVSHHVPTYLNYPEQYKGSLLSDAFTVELFPLIEKKQPDFWIYGHHHINTPGFEIGKTQLLTNQLGYVRYGEQALFQSDKIILL